VRSATLVVVPVQPSPMDFWATRPTLDMALQEKRPALVVLNRVPPRARLADDLIARIDDLGAPVAETRIGNRVALASALMTGRSVTESDRSSRAAQEMRALAEEILSRV
jgi:chromosome partitioning protein